MKIGRDLAKGGSYVFEVARVRSPMNKGQECLTKKMTTSYDIVSKL
jgi:hypothetical protein